MRTRACSHTHTPASRGSRWMGIWAWRLPCRPAAAAPVLRPTSGSSPRCSGCHCLHQKITRAGALQCPSQASECVPTRKVHKPSVHTCTTHILNRAAGQTGLALPMPMPMPLRPGNPLPGDPPGPFFSSKSMTWTHKDAAGGGIQASARLRHRPRTDLMQEADTGRLPPSATHLPPPAQLAPPPPTNMPRERK